MIIHMIDEQWKVIPDTNERYEVSNMGKVRTLRRRPKELTLTKQPKGYLYAMVQLSNGKKKNCRVHRLVAKAFIPNPDNLPEINHKDGNKLNNNVSNLEWSTRSHNVKHSFDTGLKKPPRHRLTDEEKRHLSELRKGTKMSKEARMKISASLKARHRGLQKPPEVI